MATQTHDRYRIFGGPGSPYSHKMRAVMRYRRIPHDWVIVLGGFDGTAQTEKLRPLGKPMFPIVQFPDGTSWCDSTPIIHELETRYPGERSVIPPTPARRFLARLIEDFADEWLPIPLLAFRWTSDEDVDFCARRQMQGWLGAISEADLSAGIERFVARQRRLRMILGAANPAAMPMFVSQYETLLDILETGLSRSLFLFGERPSIADFGLHGMFSQFVIDPTPSRILRERAVRLFQWTQYSDDLSGHDGDWSAAPASSETVRGLVKLAGRTLLPLMLAVSQAVARGEQMTSYEIDGVRLTGIARSDVARCWLWLKQMFADLPEADRQGLRGLLEEAGFWEALAFAPGEAECVPTFAMS
ncbi:glutathione S-transferase family protein [Reyranella sp.]|uniref:glutathione S-transferase family protein n=1 Tax=Reyranella sp. TaxID=1929291 RepID=UPI0037834A57